MNKAELARRLAKENDITIKSAAGLVDSMLSIISAGIGEDGTVSLSGFGTFRKNSRKYNYSDSEVNSVSFSAGEKLRREMNG